MLMSKNHSSAAPAHSAPKGSSSRSYGSGDDSDIDFVR